MQGLRPPPWAPEDLFLKLLEWPRPTLPLGARLEAAPDVELRVQAISQLEFRQAGREKSRTARAIVALALTDAGGARVFASANEVGELGARDLRTVHTAVMHRLSECSPLLGVIDAESWRRVLLQACETFPTLATQVASSGAYVLGMGKPFFNEEPERYWGCARRDLLDGHLLIYRACRKWVDP